MVAHTVGVWLVADFCHGFHGPMCTPWEWAWWPWAQPRDEASGWHSRTWGHDLVHQPHRANPGLGAVPWHGRGGGPGSWVILHNGSLVINEWSVLHFYFNRYTCISNVKWFLIAIFIFFMYGLPSSQDYHIEKSWNKPMIWQLHNSINYKDGCDNWEARRKREDTCEMLNNFIIEIHEMYSCGRKIFLWASYFFFSRMMLRCVPLTFNKQ